MPTERNKTSQLNFELEFFAWRFPFSYEMHLDFSANGLFHAPHFQPFFIKSKAICKNVFFTHLFRKFRDFAEKWESYSIFYYEKSIATNFTHL